MKCTNASLQEYFLNTVGQKKYLVNFSLQMIYVIVLVRERATLSLSCDHKIGTGSIKYYSG